MKLIVWIGVGGLGGVGACARVLLDVEVNRRLRRPFPVGTMAVNLSGAFALGVLAGAHVTGDAYMLAATATLGSFTTFSTWMVQSERLAVAGDGGLALLNVAGLMVQGSGAGWAVAGKCDCARVRSSKASSNRRASSAGKFSSTRESKMPPTLPASLRPAWRGRR
jgi:CrcB protein